MVARWFMALATMAVLAGCGGAAPPVSSSTLRSAAPSASGALLPVKGAYTNIVAAGGPLWVAKEQGFFAQNGLDVSLASLPGSAHVPALLSGELQLASVGPTELAAADLEGANVVAVASSADLPTFSLFADKKYSSVADLAGQSVGVTAIGSSSDAVAHLFLSKFGVLDKVKITPAGGTSTTILAALKQGVIAGAILAQPTGAASRAGYVELVNGVKLGVPFAQGDIIVTRAYAKEHPDVVKSYLRAYVQAWRFASDPANKAAMVKIFQKYTSQDAAVSEEGYAAQLPVWQLTRTPAVNAEAFGNTLTFGSSDKIKGVDPKQFFDNSYIEEVAAQLK
ncbi:MAG TPA: ABC transporter substrate-binding protein [Chloroflexota bacterium]|nr:ABC transporter substrate-binding protein [Chloroflexota bacterium]